ncbi:MAG: hypothetical protein V3R64_04605 [Sphingomonadales bacterium]
MLISVVNHSNIRDEDVQIAIRAVNRQIAEDFEPHWHIGGALKLEGALSENPNLNLMATNMRGNAIIYLEDEYDENDPFGFHDRNQEGIPFGVVFTELAENLGEPWQVTFSHEALELLADPEVNRLVMGPHPDYPDEDVFHWLEVCDAVQAEQYEIDHIPVSNFVLPLYFTGGEEWGGRNDFLGTRIGEGSLTSFNVNPGGYVGFYDPFLGGHDQVFADKKAKERNKVKQKFGIARRGTRYQKNDQVLENLMATRGKIGKPKPRFAATIRKPVIVKPQIRRPDPRKPNPRKPGGG